MANYLTTTNGHKVLFSDEDVFTALANTWTVTTDGYAKRFYEQTVDGNRKRWVKYFHREVMQPKGSEIIDHINQDKLDNRRENLRIATKSLNALNSKKTRSGTGYRGVQLNKQADKYQALITVDKKTHHLGFYDSVKEASKAYLKAQEEAINGKLHRI